MGEDAGVIFEREVVAKIQQGVGGRG